MASKHPPSPWATLGLLCLLPLASAAVYRLGLNRCHRWIMDHTPTPTSVDITIETAAATTAQWVMAVNRRHSLYTAPCLTESLVLVWLLRRQGIPATVALGIRTVFGPLESHAWASLKGRPLNDRPEVTRIYDRLDWTNASMSKEA